MKTFVAQTADQWRKWLDKHHDSESEVWLIFHAALKKHPTAWRYFEGLAPSHRRRYIGWIESAKHEETKARRLKEAIRLLNVGKPLGLK